MSKQASGDVSEAHVVARNRKARHDYHILETWEAGIALTGTEIKSVRAGKVNLKGAFGVLRNGEVWLEGMNISPYESSGYVTHEPERSRKLLLHRREIRRLIGAVEQKGLTLVPLDMHFAKGYAKITLALARGKRAPDKREDLKKRSAEREMARSVGRQR